MYGIPSNSGHTDRGLLCRSSVALKKILHLRKFISAKQNILLVKIMFLRYVLICQNSVIFFFHFMFNIFCIFLSFSFPLKTCLKIYTPWSNGLKRYSVILTTSFYSWYESEDINKKTHLQNFNWFQFYIFKLCMIMCVSCSHRLLCWKSLIDKTFCENCSHFSLFLWGNLLLVKSYEKMQKVQILKPLSALYFEIREYAFNK